MAKIKHIMNCICNECNEDIEVVENKLLQRGQVNINVGNFTINCECYKLWYIVCPFCGNWMFLSVTDYSMLYDVDRMKRYKASKALSSCERGKNAAYAKAKVHLANKRNELKQELECEFIFDEWTCSMHKVNFIDYDELPATHINDNAFVCTT